MEDDLKKKWKITSQKWKNGPQVQLKKATLIGCDIIVNSPSDNNYVSLTCDSSRFVQYRPFLHQV